MPHRGRRKDPALPPARRARGGRGVRCGGRRGLRSGSGARRPRSASPRPPHRCRRQPALPRRSDSLPLGGARCAHRAGPRDGRRRALRADTDRPPRRLGAPQLLPPGRERRADGRGADAPRRGGPGAERRARWRAGLRALRRVRRLPQALGRSRPAAGRPSRAAPRGRRHGYRARGGLPGAPRARGGGLRADRRPAVDGDRLPRGRCARGARDPPPAGRMTGAPIREAIVFTDPQSVRAIAGVPLLVRTILVLQRAGLERGTLASAEAPPARVERALLRALENPRDGYLDRLLYRRLSRPTTRVLARSPCSPNAVTLVGIGLGALGGVLLGLPGQAALLAAFLCLLASGVLDCSDGELARLRFAESRLGHWLDVSGDTVVHVCVLGGIAARIAASGRSPGWAALTGLGAGVLGAFAVMTWSEQSEARRRRVPGWENRLLDGVLSPLSTRDWYVFMVAFALARQLEWLVPAAAVGAQVFWVAGLVALVRVLGRVPGVHAPQ